jgi:hypothetical protein
VRSGVSAYQDALQIDPDDSDQRVKLAADILADGEDVVMLGGALALHSTGHELICEVVDPSPGARRCENEYEVLMENAQRLLERSKLGTLLPPLPRRWRMRRDA